MKIEHYAVKFNSIVECDRTKRKTKNEKLSMLFTICLFYTWSLFILVFALSLTIIIFIIQQSRHFRRFSLRPIHSNCRKREGNKRREEDKEGKIKVWHYIYLVIQLNIHACWVFPPFFFNHIYVHGDAVCFVYSGSTIELFIGGNSSAKTQ